MQSQQISKKFVALQNSLTKVPDFASQQCVEHWVQSLFHAFHLGWIGRVKLEACLVAARAAEINSRVTTNNRSALAVTRVKIHTWDFYLFRSSVKSNVIGRKKASKQLRCKAITKLQWDAAFGFTDCHSSPEQSMCLFCNRCNCGCGGTKDTVIGESAIIATCNRWLSERRITEREYNSVYAHLCGCGGRRRTKDNRVCGHSLEYILLMESINDRRTQGHNGEVAGSDTGPVPFLETWKHV